MSGPALRFKAGDTFDYSAEIPAYMLDVNTNWSARSWIRDTDAGEQEPVKIDELTCTVTAPVVSGDPYVVRVYRDGGTTGTGLWPRPESAGELRRLVMDIEFYDDQTVPTIQSLDNIHIDIEYDPTRPG